MEFLQPVLAVLVVFGCLGGALWWMRNRGLASFSVKSDRKKAGILSQAERLSLSPTHTLHLIRMADRAILMVSWPGGCQTVESSAWSQIAQSAENPR